MTAFNDLNTKQLQELVTCAICLGYYKDPRILPCSHTFCFRCIKKTIRSGNFSCPFQDNMKIVRNNIISLPVNRTAKDIVEFISIINLPNDKKHSYQCDECSENQAVNWCEKCDCYYCESCTQSVHSHKALQSHTMVALQEKVQSFCINHSDEKFKYWCKTCEVLVCRDCLSLQHKDHTFLSLTEAASEAKTKFQQTTREMDEIKRILTRFSRITKNTINQRREEAQQQKQNIEQTFANLQRMLEERKRTVIKQLEDNELQTMNVLDRQQNLIDQHLNLTIVQGLCAKILLDSNDLMQILKFKSTLSHNYKDFMEQYKKIDEGYTIACHTFEKDDKDVEEILGIISKLGRFNRESFIVNRDGIEIYTLPLDISQPYGKTKFTEKGINYARGYKFSLKQPFRIHFIRIQSDHIGQHVGFVLNDAGIIISNGTVNSDDSTMKWLTIPLKYDIKNNYSVFVWASSDKGSYIYKNGDYQPRIVNQNCSVESKYACCGPQISIGAKILITDNTYSINMILDIEG